MSDNFVEQKLTFDDDGIPTYTVKIKDFKNKMKTWQPGQKISSDQFIYQNTRMSLSIYPNGHSIDANGYVSVFLRNLSQDPFEADFELGLANELQNCMQRNINPGAGNGTHRLLYHLESSTDDDEVLKISCKIKALRKNVTTVADQKIVGMLTSMEAKIENIGSLQEWKDTLASIKSKIEEGASIIEEKIEDEESTGQKILAKLEALESKITNQSNNNFVKPRCMVCYEEMSSSTKIAQCISGHLLCGSCKERAGERDCSFCGQPVNGRAFGMETYLRTIFG